jgi:hypothetical protein
MCFALGGLVMSAGALAQTPPAKPKASTPAEAAPIAPAKPSQAPTTAKPVTPAPAATPAIARKGDGGVPQGFSVVLVLGDLQGAPTSDDVPPAARKALTDMRDFLPFKSYKLLDAAWLLCCGQNPGVAAVAPRGQYSDLGGAVSQILRGPEEQEYELRLSTSRADNGRVFVRFALSSMRGLMSDAVADARTTEERSRGRELADLADRKASLEHELAAKRASNETPQAEIARLQAEIQELSRRSTEVKGAAGRTNMAARMAGQSGGNRAVIDTSFTMDVGETVVVGTSRLRGGSKALIALLTAVPPRSSRRE